MKWKQPPVIKIYEALGAVVDGRIVISGNTARVLSSSGGKTYDVSYDPTTRAIMTNDNGSFWRGYLGYPAVAYLLKIGVLPYQLEEAQLLAGIPWKDINQRYKNDFDKTLASVTETLSTEQRGSLQSYVDALSRELVTLNLSLLGGKQTPPEGY